MESKNTRKFLQCDKSTHTRPTRVVSFPPPPSEMLDRLSLGTAQRKILHISSNWRGAVVGARSQFSASSARIFLFLSPLILGENFGGRGLTENELRRHRSPANLPTSMREEFQTISLAGNCSGRMTLTNSKKVGGEKERERERSLHIWAASAAFELCSLRLRLCVRSVHTLFFQRAADAG